VPLAGESPIVFCTYGLYSGGAERQWINLAAALWRRALPVFFVTYEPLVGANCHYLPLLKESGVPLLDACQLTPPDTSSIPDDLDRLFDRLGFGTASMVLRLIVAFRFLSPACIFSQLDEPNIFAEIATRLCGVRRYLTSFRNHNPTNSTAARIGARVSRHGIAPGMKHCGES